MNENANEKKKLFMVFGTRPEAIKLVPLIKVLKASAEFDLTVCVTAQHRQLLDGVLSEFGVSPDIDLSLMRDNQTLDYVTVQVLSKVGKLLDIYRPRFVIVHGDTSTAFASALAAFYRKIPIIHIEAGLRSKNIFSPYPEEFNRRAISLMASYHFSPTEVSATALLNEGVPQERIFTVGNTVIDTLALSEGDAFPKEFSALENEKYLLMTVHRREQSDDDLANIFEAVKEICLDHPQIKVIYPLHKSPRLRSKAQSAFDGVDNMILTEPLRTGVFHGLLRRCFAVLTDSGGIQEEASYLGKPTLVLRNVTERSEGEAAGSLKVVGTDKKKIYDATALLIQSPEEYAKMARRTDVFGNGKSSELIAEVLKGL